MGGKTQKVGNQNLYYCAKSEKAWKKRDNKNPTWNRGSECSMVRSINIAKTDKLVWDMIISVLKQIWERYAEPSEFVHPINEKLHDLSGLLTDGIKWKSLDQIERLSELDRKNVVSSIINCISVFFDTDKKQHRIDIEFSETFSSLLVSVAKKHQIGDGCHDGLEGISESIYVDNGPLHRENAPYHEADQMSKFFCPAQPFGHGGIGLDGPSPQTPDRVTPKLFSISSGPVTLDIRPLSDYQQQLVETILSLRSRGWSDRQIGNHFNETGYLTPRGHRWSPQSVFSIRKKYQARLERLGEG